ncbi:DeoR/GlpR family DNA-binding transcription regulator [Sinomonas sp. P47F7]|uniref:DeoR/GlpR family DNA-binding transcription regulator n=1 Tax=Sinomonas sp. P47F7 TaxID=3410987 RepID=UPI003BF4A39C
MSSAIGLNTRQGEIMNRLTRQGFVSISELALSFSVSDMTIRRDARELSRRGLARVVHGGISLPNGSAHTADFGERASRESEGKERIARTCLGMISQRETIIVDAGTTCFEIVRQLPPDFRGTIITHSAPVIQQGLRLESARTISLGGELLHDSQAFIGEMTVSALEKLRAQKVFVGAAAVRPNGLYVDRDLELSTKRALINSADQVVVVATVGKMNHSAVVHLMDFSLVDILVTDAPPPAAISAALADAGVTILVANHDA